jgi:glycosyltransferase involved in cell wall biosynthesis
MTMKLLVAIPTWNRADRLDEAIRAIVAAHAVTDTCEVSLFISDNLSSDHTAEIAAKWMADHPWISYRRWETFAGRWEDILGRLASQEPQEFDYIWLHGDDDHITDPDAFNQVAYTLAAAQDDPPAMVHVCQTRRAIPGDQRLLAGNLEELANQIGWLELLGWISSLVLSRETMNAMLACPHWQTDAISSFIHAEVLLQVGYGKTIIVMASGMIDPQDEVQTAQTTERWTASNAGARYWWTIPNLLKFKMDGLLTEPLTLGFFRYHTYSLWDRFAVEVMTAAADGRVSDEYFDLKLSFLARFQDLLGFREDRKLYGDWVACFADEVAEVRRAIRKLQARIDRSNSPSYSFDLLPPA